MEFYSNITQKNNRDLINIKAIKGVKLVLIRSSLLIMLQYLLRVQPLPLAPLLVLFSTMRNGNTYYF